MTLQQLKYVIAISEKRSMNEAAKKLFISQPTLSNSIKDLEEEIGIVIFDRNNKGIIITNEGEDFLSYAKQVISQFELLEEKYIDKKDYKKKFAVSTQHYSFAVKAFIEMVKGFDVNLYELAIRETKTHEVLNDVKLGKSEIGVLYINEFNKKIMNKLFKEYSLEFHNLVDCNVYVYLSSKHPLADKELIYLSDLDEYPCLSFEQGEYNSFYFAEEILSTYEYKRVIKACDRATMLNLMIGLNGFTLCSGIISQDLNGDEYRAIKLEVNDIMSIGYIKKENMVLSSIGEKYIHELNEYIKDQGRVKLG